MSGQLKEVRNRIASVNSTQQITKAMKLVSASKLRKAQGAIIEMRPYANKLYEMLGNVIGSLEGSDFDLNLAEEREVDNVLIVAVSSDRGLCGAFNSNVIKNTWNLLHGKYKKQYEAGNVTILPIGKKVYEAFKKEDINLIDDFAFLFADLNFDICSDVSRLLVDKFTSGEADVVEVTYAKFKNAATQEFVAERYLPIIKPEVSSNNEEGGMESDYIFEPNKHKIIEDLIPKILRTQFFRYLLDSNASEHGARMTAMDKATDNANEMLKELKVSYNRARQAAITTELIEIVSGAAALNG